jgi:hypothetical protein
MPAPVDLTKRGKDLRQLPLGALRLIGPVYRRAKHLYIKAGCSVCGQKREYAVNNLLSGRTKNCRCQRAVKYERNPLARIFGQRFDAIRQRGDKNKCRLSREEFVNYLLQLSAAARPKITTPKQLRTYRIERANRNRGFEIGNLRLTKSPT